MGGVSPPPPPPARTAAAPPPTTATPPAMSRGDTPPPVTKPTGCRARGRADHDAGRVGHGGDGAGAAAPVGGHLDDALLRPALGEGAIGRGHVVLDPLEALLRTGQDALEARRRPRHLDVEPVRGAARTEVDAGPRERGLRLEAGLDPGVLAGGDAPGSLVLDRQGRRGRAGACVAATAAPAASVGDERQAQHASRGGGGPRVTAREGATHHHGGSLHLDDAAILHRHCARGGWALESIEGVRR